MARDIVDCRLVETVVAPNQDNGVDSFNSPSLVHILTVLPRHDPQGRSGFLLLELPSLQLQMQELDQGLIDNQPFDVIVIFIFEFLFWFVVNCSHAKSSLGGGCWSTINWVDTG